MCYIHQSSLHVAYNVALDLDSIASSIAYAWVLSEVKKSPAVALVQVDRADLNLRPENLYAFKRAGLTDSLDELLTLTDIAEFQSSFPAHKFALVDHNRLAPRFSTSSPDAQVVSVIDHHEDEKLYPTASPRIISPVGSCASLITTQLPPEPLPDLALLLLSAILIDTDGLKPGGKAEQTDRESALFLAPKSTIASSIPPISTLDQPNPDALYEAQAIKDLTKILRDTKADVSRLSPFDLLRRDYKESTYTLTSSAGSTITIKVGLSTVVSGLKSWATNGAIEQAAIRWMTQRSITILGVCTSFRDTKKRMGKKSDKGKHKREQAWFVLAETELAKMSGHDFTTEILANRLWTGLEAAGEALRLERYKKFGYLEKASRLPPESRAKAYKQKNVDASRKVIAPLVKNILESPFEAKKD